MNNATAVGQHGPLALICGGGTLPLAVADSAKKHGRDLVLGMAKNGGAVGFVTDGCVRDLPGIRDVGLPCFSIGVSPNSPARSGPGTVGMPIVVAGHPIASGDVIVADQDGVVVVPQARLAEVIARLPAIRKAEADMLEAVEEGLRLPAFLSKA